MTLRLPVVAGLGTAAGRSVLREFDDVVATLELALDDLHASHALLTRCRGVVTGMSPTSHGLETVISVPMNDTSVTSNTDGGGRTEEVQAQRVALADGINLSDVIGWLDESRQRAAAMSMKLGEWRSVVTSHQSASRVLKWSVSQVGPAQ